MFRFGVAVSVAPDSAPADHLEAFGKRFTKLLLLLIPPTIFEWLPITDAHSLVVGGGYH